MHLSSPRISADFTQYNKFSLKLYFTDRVPLILIFN